MLHSLMYFEDELANSKRTWGSQGKCGSDEVYNLTLSCEFIIDCPSFSSTENILLSIIKLCVFSVSYRESIYAIYRTSLAVQWVRLPLPIQGAGSIPGWGTKITHATQCGQKIYF